MLAGDTPDRCVCVQRSTGSECQCRNEKAAPGWVDKASRNYYHSVIIAYYTILHQRLQMINGSKVKNENKIAGIWLKEITVSRIFLIIFYDLPPVRSKQLRCISNYL